MSKSKTSYLIDKRVGATNVSVDAWDEFERMRDEIKIEEIIKKGEDNMKFGVLVRLTKNYNVAEFSASEVETPEDLEYATNYCRTQAEQLINSYDLEVKPSVKPQTYTKEKYVTNKPEAYTPQGEVTRGDITTKYLKGGQFNIALTGIKDGKFTLEQVNALSSWDEMQSLIFGK